MRKSEDKTNRMRPKTYLFSLVLLIGILVFANAHAFQVTLTVQGSPGAVGDFRWLVEEDTTNQPGGFTPGDRSTLSFAFHMSYAPVVAKGDQSNTTNIDLPDGKSYFISVLPEQIDGATNYTIGGAPIKNGQGTVTVICNQQPIPTAQITVFVFEDNGPINNAPDQNEPGLQGFQVVIEDAAGRYGMAGGQQMMDAFGNMIGTTYNPEGTVDSMGEGFVLTDANGMANVKNLAPGKYGVYIVAPAGQGWQQTTTIEGKPVIDAWVKANEPAFFTEFGPAGYHVFVGFVKPMKDEEVLTGGKTIKGQVVNLHMSRPPAVQFYPGEPLPDCWVGLNLGAAGKGKGIYAAPCNPETGAFAIPNVPNGSYQLVFWDKNLDNIFAFLGIVVDDLFDPDLGKVPVFRWFGTLENTVFYDANENGFRDAGEVGIPEQAINLRFRDGTVYQSIPTDMMGESPLEEVFPFFNWLVAEVDFARFKATGATFIVDAGGGPLSPGSNLVPQEQAGGALERTETGPVLTQAMQLFLGQTNVIEWGKKAYAPGENGGISGMVFYATTRAENDPRYAVGEEWEPGIPRVQVNLYADGAPCGTSTPDAIIDDLNGDGVVTPADVDNYPFGWADGGLKGDEDIDHNDNGTFDAGDAVQVTWTDSWDDSIPTDCPGDPNDPFYDANNDGTGGDCYDGLRNFNQLRPGVFDGGYAFDSYVPGGVESGAPVQDGLPAGTYIVETTVPPDYELVKEESKNVDFGDTYTPSLLLLPPVCVGELHTVPAELTLFPGVPAPYAGEERPLSYRKQIELVDGLNAAADFFLYTEVPKAGRIVGIILNDLANEFDPNAPTFGEKFAPPWVPVSIRDYKGQEISRVYGDEFGAYNALVPSTYTTNLPAPSGMSPNMMTVVLNDPFLPNGDPDSQYNSQYSTFSYTFQYMPGTTTYLDTPVLPIAAFAGPNDFPLDGEFPDGTPVIKQVDGPVAGSGPYVATGESITIQSM